MLMLADSGLLAGVPGSAPPDITIGAVQNLTRNSGSNEADYTWTGLTGLAGAEKLIAIFQYNVPFPFRDSTIGTPTATLNGQALSIVLPSSFDSSDDRYKYTQTVIAYRDAPQNGSLFFDPGGVNFRIACATLIPVDGAGAGAVAFGLPTTSLATETSGPTIACALTTTGNGTYRIGAFNTRLGAGAPITLTDAANLTKLREEGFDVSGGEDLAVAVVIGSGPANRYEMGGSWSAPMDGTDWSSGHAFELFGPGGGSDPPPDPTPPPPSPPIVIGTVQNLTRDAGDIEQNYTWMGLTGIAGADKVVVIFQYNAIFGDQDVAIGTPIVALNGRPLSILAPYSYDTDSDRYKYTQTVIAYLDNPPNGDLFFEPGGPRYRLACATVIPVDGARAGAAAFGTPVTALATDSSGAALARALTTTIAGSYRIGAFNTRLGTGAPFALTDAANLTKLRDEEFDVSGGEDLSVVVVIGSGAAGTYQMGGSWAAAMDSTDWSSGHAFELLAAL